MEGVVKELEKELVEEFLEEDGWNSRGTGEEVLF